MDSQIWNIVNLQSQRILGQIDRDPDSPTFGSFDRNFWNYKIRDFSSIIQQQGILVLDVLYSRNSSDNPYYQSEFILGLIEAGVRFWGKSQLSTGSFNEYYPYESGFPPTAFSLYAVSLILKRYPQLVTQDTRMSIEKAADWLLKTPEEQALNQESAALAGLVIASKIEGVSIDEQLLEERLSNFYDIQNNEGWYNEYDGPDLGYLSVTIDSLYDIFCISGDQRAKEAGIKAAHFIANFVTVSSDFPVMINSRNTDYIVPYGISGFAVEDNICKQLFGTILKNLKSSDSMFAKTDDRYMTHYIGQSYYRSISHIKSCKIEESDSIAPSESEQFFKNCGIYISHQSDLSIIVSLAKGGIVNIFDKEGISKVDFGHRIKTDSAVAVTHWQNKDYKISFEKNEDSELKIRGQFSGHKYLRPSPFKHIILRILAFIFGNRLIKILKKKMIFSQKTFEVSFERTINVSGKSCKINDNFTNIGKMDAEKAPHYSMRHVSSAGRFTMEELLPYK